jgi:hypothetical protein
LINFLQLSKDGLMTSNAEMTHTEWAIEAAARAMYVSKYWTRAIAEPDHLLKDRSYYEAIVGGYWDTGRAGTSMYQEFRGYAAAGVPAATPGILAALADKAEDASIERAETESDDDRAKPLTLMRGTDVANWVRREAAAGARAEFLTRRSEIDERMAAK